MKSRNPTLLITFTLSDRQDPILIGCVGSFQAVLLPVFVPYLSDTRDQSLITAHRSTWSGQERSINDESPGESPDLPPDDLDQGSSRLFREVFLFLGNFI